LIERCTVEDRSHVSFPGSPWLWGYDLWLKSPVLNKTNNETIGYEKDLLQRKNLQHFQGPVTKLFP